MNDIGKEITLEYIRASGPGGQNVNKVATAVQLRFDVARSNFISAEVRARLMKIAGKRISGGGVLVIEARRFRTREQNRRDALRRFHRLINTAGEEPKLRRRTKPTQASRESRLLAKEKRSEVKKYRAKRSED